MRPASSRPPRRALGLTLLELAIALAVMAILGALALPSLGARLERQRLEGAAQALAADLTEARYTAAQRNQALDVAITAGPGWCWAVTTAPGCGCGLPRNCLLRSGSEADHPGVRLLEGTTMRVQPDGTAPAGTVAVLASPHDARLHVQVSAVGRPRVCAPAGGTGTGAFPRLPSC